MAKSKYTRHPFYPGIRIPKKEKWKSINGFEGCYEISTWGRVRSLDRVVAGKGNCGKSFGRWRGRMKALAKSNQPGHRAVSLFKNGICYQCSVHRLVLETFVGPCPDGMEACHFPDRDPANNHLENLRWDTSKNNHADRKIHGTNGAGEKNPAAKLTQDEVKEIRRLHSEGIWTYRQLGDKFQVSFVMIGYIVKGKNWTFA